MVYTDYVGQRGTFEECTESICVKIMGTPGTNASDELFCLKEDVCGIVEFRKCYVYKPCMGRVLSLNVSTFRKEVLGYNQVHKGY